MAESTLSQRNTLWILAALTAVGAPHFQRLPWWAITLAVLLMLWRAYLGYGRLPLPRRWLLLGLATGAMAAVYLYHRTLFGRDAGVMLLLVLLPLKALETRSVRDAMILIFIGYFLVLTNFLYSQSILTALYMLFCVWIMTAAMVSLNQTQPGPYRHLFRTAALLLAQSAPLMLVLFIFFPRVQGPLWGLPQDAFSGTSGLSDTMSPGTLSNLILSDAIAFRVEFSASMPPAKELYWRGPVLPDFDGRSWTAPANYNGQPEPHYQADGTLVRYQVTLEPNNRRWLFALDLPAEVPPDAVATPDFQLIANTPVVHRIRYAMVSHLEAKYGQDESPLALKHALQLPAGFNPRTLQLARSLRREFADDKALMASVLSMFRDQNFFYTTSPPLLGRNSIDDFLFDTRRGFCEHYASAFAVLMRAAGIPARIVTGYQGGEINPLGNYLIVRQADAHAWTEVWLRNEGWMRVDPTAAVSPLRIERGIAAAVRTDGLPLFDRTSLPWLRQLGFTWDSVANAWNQWVLGYNPERQRRLLSGMGVDDATWRTLTVALVVATGMVTLLLALFMLRRLRIATRDPAKRAYLRFCDKLARQGLPRGPSEGPVDYAARLARLRPDLATATGAITTLYISLRYGASRAPLQARELLTQIKQFRP